MVYKNGKTSYDTVVSTIQKDSKRRDFYNVNNSIFQANDFGAKPGFGFDQDFVTHKNPVPIEKLRECRRPDKAAIDNFITESKGENFLRKTSVEKMNFDYNRRSQEARKKYINAGPKIDPKTVAPSNFLSKAGYNVSSTKVYKHLRKKMNSNFNLGTPNDISENLLNQGQGIKGFSSWNKYC
jgi:hypothetical protein